MDEFIGFPYWLYRHDPYWVPPLRIAQKQLFDVRRHPFYAHAEMQCFLARTRGRTAGRIAAIFDRNYNEFHAEQAGFFGFLETAEAQPVAEALLDAARSWLIKKGARMIRGPVNPSMNYECGLLVDGFDSSPRIMMTYNPPYYAVMLERAGLSKAKDLYAYYSPPDRVLRAKVERVAERSLHTNGVRIRALRIDAFDEELERVWKVYNSAWSRNWGFVPMTREEFYHTAREMKPILKPDLALVGEVDGQAVGFALALPDINQALKRAGGRLFPFGLPKILYYQRSIRSLRVIALGVVQAFRTSGVAAAFYATLIRNSLRLGYENCEMSWILEDNVLMNRSIEALGVKRYKTYRIYEWN
jgi:GNAT superfamily N-acetyltransferase